MESNKFIIWHDGLSIDRRTNKWQFKCKKCSMSFSPITTILSKQEVICPKCGQSELINYHELN